MKTSNNDLDREIQLHLELEREDLIAEGVSADEAFYVARRRFGNVTRVKETVYEIGRLRVFDNLLQDLKLGLRRMLRSPGVTGLTVFTIAIGVAASTTVLSIVDVIVWHPLPFHHADELVSLWAFSPNQRGLAPTVPLATLDAWTAKDQIFQEVNAYALRPTHLSGKDDTALITGGFVSNGLFRALGVSPAYGRDFGPEDFGPSSQGPVVIVSDQLWRTRFAADPHLIGQHIAIDDNGVTVVGVMHSGFAFPLDTVQLWMPLVPEPEREIPTAVVGRLRPGVSLSQAQTFAESTTGELRNATGLPLPQVRVQPFTHQDPKTVTALTMVAGAVVLLLLLAIANVSNLLLSQAVGRDGEMAVRLSLGATRTRLTLQIVTETLLLALIATGLALVISSWMLNVAPSVLPGILTYQALRAFGLDVRSFLFAGLGAVTAGLGASVAPMMRIHTTDLHDVLERASRGTRAHTRLRNVLLIAQLAITFVLLICAGLLSIGFVRLAHEDPGFQFHNVLTADLDIPPRDFPGRLATDRFFEDLRRAASHLPGVISATVSESIPPYLRFRASTIETSDSGFTTGSDVRVAEGYVDDAFFSTLGIRVLKGRTFNATDRLDGPTVAIVGRAFAQHLWRSENVIGYRFRFPPDDDWITVVGVAGDVKNGGFDNPLGELAVYYTRQQIPQPMRYASFVVRTASAPESFQNAIRKLLRDTDANVAVLRMTTATDLIAASNARVRFATSIMATFAAIALVVALVGVYGSFWYTVKQRTHEIAIRMAIGATPKCIERLVLADSVRLALVGLTIGIVLAPMTTRLFRSLLFEVSPTQPLVFVAVALGLAFAVIVAAYLPARSASLNHPAVVLKQSDH